VRFGRGWFVARGVPVERYTDWQNAAAFFGMGLYWGKAVSQNKKGHLLGHVKVRAALESPTAHCRPAKGAHMRCVHERCNKYGAGQHANLGHRLARHVYGYTGMDEGSSADASVCAWVVGHWARPEAPGNADLRDQPRAAVPRGFVRHRGCVALNPKPKTSCVRGPPLRCRESRWMPGNAAKTGLSSAV
jgi:hypothetical protein